MASSGGGADFGVVRKPDGWLFFITHVGRIYALSPRTGDVIMMHEPAS